MQVSNLNDVKIYNLSAGKSLPEWLSAKKRKKLEKKDIDIRRRIELIQDFCMPDVSSCVRLSADGQYILATGVYKPRVRCYEVANLSMKFERCMDSEVIKFEVLSEDYRKMVFLQEDRYVEVHAQYGHYYRLRIPKFGRDMKYDRVSCDLYLVGTGPEIYRLNLEQGRFLNPFITEGTTLNACDLNPFHRLLVVGTADGRIEGWDPRSRQRVATLDSAFHSLTQDTEVVGLPSVSSIHFRDAMMMGVGTATGQILLYDIRSSRPLLVKDHMYGLPIKAVDFHSSGVVLSLDARALKLWHPDSGKPYTTIESETELNDLCMIPQSGLLFMAHEGQKLLTYYIPSLGPAPRWCSFLDHLTEELEEDSVMTVYDDYKFVTKQELETLGLSHLIGTNLLRAYLHGFFMDVRLWNKARSVVQPFSFDEYRKKKIKEKLEQARENRVSSRRLPKVNQSLAVKLMDEVEDDEEDVKSMKKKKQPDASLLHDSRFKAMFQNPDFQIDTEAQEYKLIQPLVKKLDKTKKKQQKKREVLTDQFDEVEEGEGKESNDEVESSSDDDREWTKEVKKQYRLLKKRDREERRQEDQKAKFQPRFFELKEGEEFKGVKHKLKQIDSSTLGERLKEDSSISVKHVDYGNKEMKFMLTSKKSKAREAALQHKEERKKLRRSIASLKLSSKSKWK